MEFGLFEHSHVLFDVVFVNQDVTDFEGILRSLGCFGFVVGFQIVDQSAGDGAVLNVFAEVVAADAAAQQEHDRFVTLG